MAHYKLFWGETETRDGICSSTVETDVEELYLSGLEMNYQYAPIEETPRACEPLKREDTEYADGT